MTCIVMPMILLFISLSSYSKQPAEDGVVIITSSKSSIRSMSIMEVRRLYLGLPSADNKEIGKAILNLSSAETYNLFLKNIMHMTEYRYKRRLVKRVFRYGTSTIKEMESLEDISKHLLNNRNDITFVKTSTLGRLDDVKVVLRLW